MKQLITIDYLILNMVGEITQTNTKNTPFKFELAERGTRNFSSLYTLFYNNERFGTLVANPYEGSVIAKDLAQLQIDNAIFYTKTLQELKQIIWEFTQFTSYEFKAVNRLDIAIDKADNGNYKQLCQDLFTGKTLLAGRNKSVSYYCETDKGKMIPNGITVGKRTNSRLLRIYNKTLNLKIVPKDYIDTWHQNNGLTGEIWRFEYQLNARFFDDLKKVSPIHETVTENMTWGVFDTQMLVNLIEMAEKNHFELKENTGKTEINKEKTIVLHAWDTIKKAIGQAVPIVQKIKKILDLTPVVKKRLAKSLFREYYITGQSLHYIIALNHLLQESKLLTWFNEKMKYYLAEFHSKEHIKDTFSWSTYQEHEQIFI